MSALAVSLSCAVGGCGWWVLDALRKPVVLLSLRDAEFGPGLNRGPSAHVYTAAGETKLAFFTHPPSRIEWTFQLPPVDHIFRAEVVLDPQVWDRSDGVEFEVVVRHSNEAATRTSLKLDPREHRGWVPIEHVFRGHVDPLTISLQTTPGKAGNLDFDWAYWGEPRIKTPVAGLSLGQWLFVVVGVVVSTLLARVFDARPIFRAAGYVTYLLCVSALLLELALRAYPWRFPRNDQHRAIGGSGWATWVATLANDEVLGYRYKPDLELSIVRTQRRAPGIADKMSSIRFTTDSDGFRNLESVASPRVVLLGDSFVEGYFVDDNETIGAVLSKKLGIPTRSLALSGYGPDQYAAVLERYSALSPELVAVFLFTGNDIEDAWMFPRWRQSGLRWVDYEVKGYRLTRSSFVVRPRLTWHLATVADEFARVAGIGKRDAWLPVPDPWLCAEGVMPHCTTFEPMLSLRETMSEEEWRQHAGFTRTIELLSAIHQTTTTMGAELVVFIIPTKSAVHLPPYMNDENRRVWDRVLRATAKGSKLDRPDLVGGFLTNHGAISRVFTRTLEAKGIPAKSLSPAFRRLADRGETAYLRDDLHWSPHGHRVVAQEVVRVLEAAPR